MINNGNRRTGQPIVIKDEKADNLEHIPLLSGVFQPIKKFRMLA